MGYGTHKWTCGECGESYETSGVVGGFALDCWRREHKEEHRVAKMSDAERSEYWQRKLAASMWADNLLNSPAPPPGDET